MEQQPSSSSFEKTRFSQTESTFSSRVMGSLVAHRSHITIAVLIFVALASVNHIFFPRYTAKAVLLVQRAENSPMQAMMGKMIGNPNFGGKQNEYLEKYLQYLNSHEFYLAAARAMKDRGETHEPLATPSVLRGMLSQVRGVLQSLLYAKISDPSERANEIEALAVSLNSNALFSKSGQDNISLQVRGADFREAVRRANFLSESAVKVITESELKELNDAKRYIDTQEAETAARLQNFDSAIVDYRKGNKLVKADASGRDMFDRVRELRRNLEINQLKYNQNERLVTLLNRELHGEEEQILSHGSRSIQITEVLNQLREQVQGLRYKKMLFQAQGLGEDSPQIQSLDTQIDKLAERIKDRVRLQGGNQSDVASLLTGDREGLVRKISTLTREGEYLSTSIDTLNKALSEAQQPLEALPAAQQKMLGFQRNTFLEFTLLQEMKKKTLEIDLERVALDSKIRILEKSTIAGIPPRFNLLPTAAFAALIGLLVSLAGAYTLDELSDSIKSRHQLSELGLVTVGSVPKVKGAGSRKFLMGGKTGRVDVLGSWKSGEESLEVMAFKHVRATVLKMRDQAGRPAQTICILGATPGDGKSFVSANIAFSLAQMGKQTLLLDCDLRRPSLGSWLRISPRLGLTSVLSGEKTLEECLSRQVQPNLDVLPSGPPSRRATELFSESAFTDLLDSFKARYDYIIIDTPPVLNVVDGLVLSAFADATMFAISHRKTKVADIQQAIEKIRYFDERPVFVVYNRAGELSQYNYIYTNTHREPTQPTKNSDVSLRNEVDNFKKWWSRKSFVPKDTYVS